MDKRPFSFRQTVGHAHLNGLQNDLERALDTRARELLGAGILKGGDVAPCEKPQPGRVRVSPTIAWDRHGRRIDARHRFTDRVDAIIPLAALREEEVADIPTGDGCLVLLAKAARGDFALPFPLESKTAMLGTDADNARAHKIHAVVETTLGGLVPKQPALLLRENVPQQGYAPGCPPTGTPLTVDVTDQEPLLVDLNRLAQAGRSAEKDTADLVPKGKHRIVTLVVRFARDLFDHRLDGHGESMPHRAVDHFAFVADTSAPPAAPGKAKPPAPPQDGALLADIRLRHGEPVTREDIDLSRQTRLHGLQDIQPDHAAQLLRLLLFGGGDLQWDGKTLRLPQDLGIGLPDSAVAHTLPSCQTPIADNHAAWVLVPRAAEQKHTLAVTVLPLGQTPHHTDSQLPILLAARRGSILYGPRIGTFAPNQTKPLAQGLSNETLKAMRERLKKTEEADDGLRDKQLQHHQKIQDLEEKLAQAREENKKLTKKATETANLLKSTREEQVRLRAGTLVNEASWKRISLPIKINALCAGKDDRYRYCRIAVGNGICYSKWRDGWFAASWADGGTVGGQSLNAVANGYKGWLAVGDQGNVCLSLGDLEKDWQRVPLNVSQNLTACATFRSRWVVVGHQGTVLSAEDGKLRTWLGNGRNRGVACPLAVRDTPSQVHLRCVAGNTERVVAGGDDGVVLFSKDGISWQQAQSVGSRNQLKGFQARALVWDEDSKCFCILFVRPDSHSEHNYLYISSDGEKWRSAGYSFHLGDLAAGDRMCVVLCRYGRQIHVGTNWYNWSGSSFFYTETKMGNRVVHDPLYHCFCRFEHGGAALWESPVGLP